LHSQNVDHQVLNGVQDEDESVLIAGAGADGAVTVATNMAGRGTDIKPDPAALEAGGLHVIGFERNSSIRIDRQLLGRAGRQGDPGSGQFFVSAEDDIVVRHDRGLTKSLRRISSADGVASKDFDRRVRRIQQVAEKVGYQSRREVMREELWLDKVKKAAG
jgi:preprotein translocase subunit SecA